MNRPFLPFLAIVLLTAVAAEATIWGVKSKDPLSDPPATLFSLDDDGGSLNVVGTIMLGSTSIDVDAIAQDAQGVLYGYQVADGAMSQLLTINTSTATATAVGAPLNLRDIRGAMFTHDGRLIVLDARNEHLLEINPATGTLVGSSQYLMLGGSVHAFTDITDLAQRPDGSIVMVDAVAGGTAFYDVDLGSASLTLLHTDTAIAGDTRYVTHAGIATAPDGNPNRLVTYDVTWDDDIFHYDPSDSWARTNGPLNIIAGYNAGRGDLAGPVAAALVLLGDANNDGVVSADDFAAVQANFGNTGSADGLLPGDANDDGVVSADDFAAIQANFGNVLGSAAGSSPIPEPATLALLIGGGLIAARRRRS